jgi:hypothetical protein
VAFFIVRFPLISLSLLLSASSLWGDTFDSEEFEEPEFQEEIAYESNEQDIEYSENLEVDPPLDHYVPEALPAPVELSSQPENLTIDLKNPTFVQGVIVTEEGGVITAPGMRIQAQKIAYTNKIENGLRVQKIVAEGDLMMEYADRVFVGSKLEYDFISKTGILWDGKTFVDVWFLGGERIELKADGTFYIYSAFVTTSENQENAWEINASKVKITDDHLLSARNIRFQFFKVPLFWFPSFKSNLKVFSDPPIRYKVVWDKGIGPRLTMRYRLFSWRDLNLFFRLDYRLQKGFGGAFESEYFSPDKLTTFVTRSYGARDKSFPYERGPHRYRLQGLYHTQSRDGKTQAHLTYDKLSDTRMVGDFRSDDFEINTQKRTRLTVSHETPQTFAHFSLQPRINRFQSIDQELPLLSLGIRPFSIGSTGIISANYASAGFLDYVFANELRHEFEKLHLSSSTQSIRLETKNDLYRPFQWGPVRFTPQVGILGIFYSKSPEHHPIGQGIFTYGGQAHTHLWHTYSKFRHLIEPYFSYQGLTKPSEGLNDHFIFDINDGYFQLNQLRIGVRNALYLTRKSRFLPTFSADLYTYGYFGKRHFAQTFPKSYLTFDWNRPSFTLKSGICWNNEEQVWDFTNIGIDWTLSEDFAFGVEFRHRSKFDWRKGNHENFILDVARPIPELLDSPLSDGRDTLLTRFQIRLAPRWTCHIQTRHGWGRSFEPRYNAGKIDLYTMLTCSWRLRLSYERIPGDNRFSGAVNLIK